jgi:pyrroline-5-carboxylate reductase
MPQSHLGILGYGKIASRLSQGWSFKKSTRVLTYLRPGRRREDSYPKYCRSLVEVVDRSDWLLLSVKPYQARALILELGDQLNSKLVVSTCATLGLDQLQSWNPKVKWVRAMPNTPVSVREGVTALCFSDSVAKQSRSFVSRAFEELGRVFVVEEAQWDAVTALSGCGPAYIFLILEALSEAGVKVGLQRELAQKMAAQTLRGAATLALSEERHPAQLKDEVTTPAGCTIDGLMALEEGALRSTLIRAVVAAAEKSRGYGST